jgi:hypothetical protein
MRESDVRVTRVPTSQPMYEVDDMCQHLIFQWFKGGPLSGIKPLFRYLEIPVVGFES